MTALWAPLLAATLSAAPTPNACLLCHPEERVLHEQSVHHAEGIECTSCHGGDATATVEDKAHAKDFRGKIPRRQLPELCASCHADVARMRPYNLPTDQYALYRTSQHGLELEKGNEDVAVCIDCHGVHDILRHTDAASRVYIRNIPKTCGRCHGNADLAKKYHWKSNPFADYAAGVHGKALLDNGSLTAPECSRCHGAHGATPPGVGDVDKVCGQCHTTTRAAFLEGPHKAGMDAEGLRECSSCHGNHRVMARDPLRITDVCKNCHADEPKPMEVAATIKHLYVSTGEEIDRARTMVAKAAAVPIFVEDYEARLEEARTLLLESMTVMHSVDAAKVRGQTERASSIATEVESDVEEKLNHLRWRWVGILVFWFYLILTIAILFHFRRKTAREAGA